MSLSLSMTWNFKTSVLSVFQMIKTFYVRVKEFANLSHAMNQTRNVFVCNIKLFIHLQQNLN
jgi:hypothetical protein